MPQRTKSRLETLLEDKIAEKLRAEEAQRRAYGLHRKQIGPSPKKAKQVLPSFLRNDKTPYADHRLLARVMTNQVYETVHDATVARDALMRTHRHLDAIFDRETKLADSGLLDSDEAAALRKGLLLQGERLTALRDMLKSLNDDRSRRLRELVVMEEAVEMESARQRKAAAAQTKTAEQLVYEGYEESGAPTIDLDPTLLAEATRGLLADPDAFNPKAAGKSQKRNTKTSL